MPTVLLIEDDPAVARATARLLAVHGYSVTVASSCREAHAICSGRRFDVGVFDIQLRDGVGTECASALARRGAVDRCIFFTGGAPEHILEIANRIGPVIAKNSVRELLHALRAT